MMMAVNEMILISSDGSHLTFGTKVQGEEKNKTQ